ncbi:hypothetical protein PPYR_02138, partial [Photinus pyralis]
GAFVSLFQDLRGDEKKFFNYFRMSTSSFDELEGKLHDSIKSQDTRCRLSIPPIEMLAVTLRFLATGDTFKTIASSYRMGESTVRKILATGKLNFPDDKPFPGCTEPIPHVIIGDEGFPLQEHLMRPYPRKVVRSSFTKQVYNYRHSRARRIVENCFGILAKRFRLYQRKLQIFPEHMDIVKNRKLSHRLCQAYKRCRIGGNSTTRAMGIRDKFAEYFMSENGAVPWQIDMVRRGCQE